MADLEATGDAGGEPSADDDVRESSGPIWLTSDRAVVVLIVGAALAVVATFAAAVVAFVAAGPLAGPTDPQSLDAGLSMQTTLLDRVTSAGQVVGAFGLITLILMGAALALLWWRVDDLEARAVDQGGAEAAEVRRTTLFVRAVRLVLVAVAIGTLGFLGDMLSARSDGLDATTWFVAFLPRFGVVTATLAGAIAGLMAARSLATGLRDLSSS